MNTFARWVLAAALLGSGAPVGSAGWLVDPTSGVALDRPTKTPSADLAEVRRAVKARTPAEAERARWWNVGGPAYRWNEIAVDTLLEEFVTLPLAARHLALVHAAVDDAVAAAAANARRRPAPRTLDASLVTAYATPKAGGYPSMHAAAASSAAEVLGYLFPQRRGEFAAKADEAMLSRVLAGVEFPSDVQAGREIGRQVAARAIAWGRADGSDVKWTGKVPEEPGKWRGTNPIAPAAANWKPWVLTRGDEFRPPAPPSYESSQGQADLAEIRTYARTPRSNHRATYWEVFGGARAYALWNEIARAKLLEYGEVFDATRSARVFALLNIAFDDAAIACWDAKYAYWQMRPSHFDAELKALFPPPNHPSYPAAHGCLSTAAATVLAAVFPRDREALLAKAKEAAEARVWAGIHTRFDIVDGQELGRKVAEKVLARGWTAP